MKKVFFLMALVWVGQGLFAQQMAGFGADVKTKKAVSVAEFKDKVEAKGSWSGVVTGSVKEVCKAEGCWLRLDDGSPNGIMVKMKDHSFTVPKDIDGKTVFITGAATKKTTSVEQLKHYAEDAGKSKAEIDAITAAKVEINIEAAGVKVVNQ